MNIIPLQSYFSRPVLIIFWVSLSIRVFFMGNHDLLTEEAYYWNYATHLDFGYLDHPPMVAFLIRLFTEFLGQNEFAVRCPALLCWGCTAYFMYRWSELIHKNSGQYSVLLLSILPFFFLDSSITTPDMPLTAAWSGALYYLYQALNLHKQRAWYSAGLCIGLGLVAKYSIALLGMTTLVLLLSYREYRFWFFKKEPYLAAILSLVLFSPIIYWNATHDWISFAFQSTRRLKAQSHFSLHHLLGVLILFLMPLGIIDSLRLFKTSHTRCLSASTKLFLQSYLLGPLSVFALFSCFHAIKLDWVGPCLLAVLPWLAQLMTQPTSLVRHWLRSSPILLGLYTCILVAMVYGKPFMVTQHCFSPMLTVSWQKLTQYFYQVARSMTPSNSVEQPILLPLDGYRMESELAFYQSKQNQQHPDLTPFPTHHAAMFGFDGLMFESWDPSNLHGKLIILIGKDPAFLAKTSMQTAIQPLSPVHKVWGETQKSHIKLIPYYYLVARVL